MFNWKEDVIAQNAIYLDDEVAGKGRQFKSRFLVPGLVKYDYGVCLLTKENADRFIQDFVGCPVIINHQDVTDRNAKEVSVGNIFSVWFDEKDGYYWCNGIITDKHAIELIDKGYSVSCQYTITEYSDNLTGALHNGNPYDKIIEDGKPEHLAIVNNPRYEGAIIAVNAIMAQNEDKWITIKPNGEENKGRHLLLKDGESVEDAMHRNGWYKKRQAKEGKEDKQEDKKEEKKEESFEKETPYSKKDENRHQKVKDLEDKAYKEFKTIYENYIHDDDMEGWGHITGSQFSKKVKEYNEKYQKAFKDLESDRFVSFDDFARREQKQSDKKEDKKEQTLDDKIKEHEDKIPKAYRRNTKTKALWLYKNHYISPTEFESAQKASNAFIEEFKDLLYQTLSEGIVNRLGELIASNEDKWITIHPHGKESDDYRRLKIKEGETVEEAMHRQGYYNKRKAGDEKQQKLVEQKIKELEKKLETVGKDTVLGQKYARQIEELKKGNIGVKEDEGKKEEKKEETPKDDKEIIKKIEELSEEYKNLDKEYWKVSWEDQDKRRELSDKKEEVKKELEKIGTSLSTAGKTWKNADGENVTFVGYDVDSRGYKVKTEMGYSTHYTYYQNYDSIEKLEQADTQGYEKAQKKQSEKTGQTKENKVGAMPKATSVKEAEKLAKEYGLAERVNFGKLSLEICNAMNESANNTLAEFPEIRKLCKEFGSLQGRNKSLIEDAIEIKGESISVQIRDRLGEIKRAYGEDYFQRNYGDPKVLEKKIAEKVQSRIKDMLRIGKATGEIAHCKYYPPSQRGVVWNEKFKDSKNFDYTVGFHPEGATSLKAICDHEFGHQINRFIDENGAPSAKYNELKTYYKSLNKDDIKNGLSGYANTNMSEWIAEGWAEYKNNPNCRPMAKKIGELLTAAYKEVING